MSKISRFRSQAVTFTKLLLVAEVKSPVPKGGSFPTTRSSRCTICGFFGEIVPGDTRSAEPDATVTVRDQPHRGRSLNARKTSDSRRRSGEYCSDSRRSCTTSLSKPGSTRRSSTGKPHDTQLGWQVAHRNTGDLTSLAADKGYDWMELREKLREDGVRPLIKHRIFRPIDPRTTRGSMGLATTSARCVRPSSRRSSARSATPCSREPVPRVSRDRHEMCRSQHQACRGTVKSTTLW